MKPEEWTIVTNFVVFFILFVAVLYCTGQGLTNYLIVSMGLFVVWELKPAEKRVPPLEKVPSVALANELSGRDGVTDLVASGKESAFCVAFDEPNGGYSAHPGSGPARILVIKEV